MEAKIKERLEVYRQSHAEWLRRRQESLSRAEECLAHANACRGAIEALEELLPPVPIETVLQSVKDAAE
jgi:hypothetical protein